MHSYTDDKGFLYKNFNEQSADQRKDDIRNGSPKRCDSECFCYNHFRPK